MVHLTSAATSGSGSRMRDLRAPCPGSSGAVAGTTPPTSATPRSASSSPRRTAAPSSAFVPQVVTLKPSCHPALSFGRSAHASAAGWRRRDRGRGRARAVAPVLTELARLLGLDHSYVRRIMDLALLAPGGVVKGGRNGKWQVGALRLRREMVSSVGAGQVKKPDFTRSKGAHQ